MQKQTVRMMLVLTLGLIPLNMAQAQGLTLGEALDAPELTWTTGSDAGIGGWAAQTTLTHDGVDAAGKVISENPFSSWISTTVTGPVAVAFWWRTVNSNGNAALLFSIDSGGNPAHEPTAVLYSSPQWSFANYAIPAGEHALHWILLGEAYYAGVQVSYSEGQLDQVRLIPIAPRIGIQGVNGVLITNGTAVADVEAGTDFGAALLTDRTASRTFAITNSGTLDLQVSSVTAGGEHAADFEVLSFPSVVRWGTQSNLVVRFDPSALGARMAEITVASDDAEAGNFMFAVGGEGLADGAYIRVTGETGIWITNGSPANAITSFGSLWLDGGSLTRSFWITNSGNAALNIAGVDLGGTHPGDFEVLSFPAIVAAGSRSNLVVRFDPVETGTRTAVVEIESDAMDVDSYAFTVSGTGVQNVPAIAVTGNGGEIFNGTMTVSTWNGTHFGGTAAFTGTVDRNFMITNFGAADLVISNVAFLGTGAAHFSAPDVPAVISPRSSSNLLLRFSPAAAGAATAVVSIANNVGHRNPYRFAVRGNGISTHYVWADSPSPEPPYLTWETAAHAIQDAASICVDGDLVWVTNGVYDSGSFVNSGWQDTATNRVGIINAIQVRSVNGPEVTTIVGGPGMRCVYLANGATLAGFTLTNGMATSGGGIYATSRWEAVVSNCVIAGNQAVYGGGVHSATLYDCLIRGNVAQHSGGGASESTLHRCRLVENQAGGYGSSDPCFPFPLPPSPTIFLEGGGGGTYSSVLYSCLLAGNTANGGGGAARSTLRNCTLVENQALGILREGFPLGGGGMFGGEAVNCIFDGNADLGSSDLADWDQAKGQCPNYPATYASIGFCLLVNPPSGTGNVTGRVTFVQGTYRLAEGSLGIDAGKNSDVLGTTDLNGQPRIVNGTVDMGAYEYQGPEPVLPGYAGWAAAIGNGLTNYHDCAAGDGYPNLLKYATGGSATEPDQAARVEHSGEDGMPRLLFRRNTNATDAILTVEGADAMDAAAVWRGIATNLAGVWNPPEVVEEGSGNPVTCTVVDPEPLASNRFLRLKVELP